MAKLASRLSSCVPSADGDAFACPSIAAGRAFSAASLDALAAEAVFNVHSVQMMRLLARSVRGRRMRLVPVALALCALRETGGEDAIAGGPLGDLGVF